MSVAAAMRSSNPASAAGARPRRSSPYSAIRACGAWAGRASPPGANGGWCAPSRAPRVLAVNADEGEPGTFKDRHYLEADPHRFVEGVLIAAWAVEAEDTYIYLRDEYPHLRQVLLREIAAAEAARARAPHHIHLRRGAGPIFAAKRAP